MTNGDKWRLMTDEQIAEIINNDGCCCCPCSAEECGTYESETKCKEAIVKWLKKEAKENDET